MGIERQIEQDLAQETVEYIDEESLFQTMEIDRANFVRKCLEKAMC